MGWVCGGAKHQSRGLTMSGVKKAKIRSPSYPYISLGEAIEKAKVVWDHAKRTVIRGEIVASYWGYKATSSGWRMAIAAMKNYGLLESVGSKKSGEVRLTDLAMQIILDVREGSPDRMAA